MEPSGSTAAPINAVLSLHIGTVYLHSMLMFIGCIQSFTDSTFTPVDQATNHWADNIESLNQQKNVSGDNYQFD